MQANVSSTKHATSLRFRKKRLLYPIRRHQQLQRYPQACPQMRRPIHNKSSLRSCTNLCANRTWTASSRVACAPLALLPLFLQRLQQCFPGSAQCATSSTHGWREALSARHLQTQHLPQTHPQAGTSQSSKWPNARRNSPWVTDLSAPSSNALAAHRFCDRFPLETARSQGTSRNLCGSLSVPACQHYITSAKSVAHFQFQHHCSFRDLLNDRTLFHCAWSS